MRFSSSEITEIIEMMNKGRTNSQIKEKFGIEDADWLYEIKYRFPDKINRIDSDYFVARKFTNPTFHYYDRIIETMKWLFSSNAKKVYKVLEQGCGDGSFAKEVADSVPNIDIIGVELTQAGVEKARRFENNRLHFLCADGYEIEGKGEYDCVYHVNVLEHVPDGIKYLEKGLELLREYGYLIFSCPTKGSWIIWGFPKYIVCKILGRKFETHSFDENEVKKFVKNKGLILFTNDYSEFTLPRRIYRYFPSFTYKILGLFSSKAERILKLLGFGRFCNFQYWHIAKRKRKSEVPFYNLPKRDLLHTLWVLPAFLIIYILYTIVMTFEVITRKKTFFQQD